MIYLFLITVFLQPRYILFSESTLIIPIIILVLLYELFFLRSKKIFCNLMSDIIKFVSPLLFLSILSYFFISLGYGDPFIKSFIKSIFIVIIPSIAILRLQANRVGGFRLLNIFFNVGVLNAILILVDSVIFNKSISSNLVFQNDMIQNTYRASGISYFSGDGLSVIYVMMLFSGYFLYSYTNKIIYLISIIITVAALFFVGRTGFYIGLLSLLVIFLRYFHFIINLRYSAIIIVTLIFILNLFQSTNQSSIDHSLELFVNLYEYGTLNTDSTTAIFNDHIIFPDNISTFLIGDGLYSINNANYMNTDIGYLRVIFYSGIFTLFLFLLVNFYYILNSNHTILFRATLLFVFIILSVKLPVFYIIPWYIFLYLIFTTSDKLNLNENSNSH